MLFVAGPDPATSDEFESELKCHSEKTNCQHMEENNGNTWGQPSSLVMLAISNASQLRTTIFIFAWSCHCFHKR